MDEIGKTSERMKRGRPQLYSAAEIRRRRTEYAKNRRVSMIYIGNAMSKWDRLRERKGWSNEETANHLIDRYSTLEATFLEHDSDENFMFNAPSPSAPSPPRMLPREYAPSPSSSSSSPVASPQSSDYTPSSPQLREQSVNVPWTRDSHVDNPMAIRSLRDVLPRKPMHEYERTSDGEEGPQSFSVKPDPSDTDSAELDSNYEHRVIIDNAEIKSEPVNLRMEPVYQFGTNEVPPVRDCENTELETKDEHPSNNASHNIKIKLEPMDDFTAKEEPPDNGNTELENNVDDEHHTNNKTSHDDDIKLKPTDSFTVKLEPPNS